MPSPPSGTREELTSQSPWELLLDEVKLRSDSFMSGRNIGEIALRTRTGHQLWLLPGQDTAITILTPISAFFPVTGWSSWETVKAWSRPAEFSKNG